MESKDRTEILLVGNELDVLDGLYRELLARSYHVTTAARSEEALSMALQSGVDVVVSQLFSPNFSGLQLLTRVHPARPRLPFILVSDVATPEIAIAAAKLGAFKLLVKPFPMSQVLELIQKALASTAVGLLPLGPGEEEYRNTGLVGMSPVMQELYRQIGLAADSSATVLIEGPTGTGKELVARAIHQNSSRAKQPLLAISGCTITESLFENELFGHESGAFTGAARSTRIGRFEQTNHGTIFLDEIGELPLAMQVKLLRFLQDKRIQRLGGKGDIELDVRVIAATNRDLQKCIQTGHFREDLYQRLSTFSIKTPPLQDHAQDITSLVRHFLRKIRADKPLASLSIQREAVEFLHKQTWTGNVRQLENVITAAAIQARHQTITLDHVQQVCPNRQPSMGETLTLRGPLTDLLEQAQAGHICNVRAQVDRSLFAKAMAQAKGNQALIAKWLGITRKTVGKQLRRFGLLSNVENDTSIEKPRNDDK